MSTTELLAQYLNNRSTMQLASVDDDQPWICTVRFVSDDRQNLYWASVPSRRHSQEITKHEKVACAIVVHDTIGEPVIGIQIEGTAAVQEPLPNNRSITKKYAAKFKRNQKWIDDFVAGHTEHRLYKLTPSAIYLFDEKNFPSGKRQKVR